MVDQLSQRCSARIGAAATQGGQGAESGVEGTNDPEGWRACHYSVLARVGWSVEIDGERIVASSPSLRISCSFYSRFCTLSSLSCCSANASWASLGELIYHLFVTGLLRSIFDCQSRKVVLLVLQQCSEDYVFIGGRSNPFVDRWPYMGVFAVWGDIGLCYWPHRWVDGTQCKCKRWFVF